MLNSRQLAGDTHQQLHETLVTNARKEFERLLASFDEILGPLPEKPNGGLIFHGTERAKELCSHLIAASMYFELTPLPDDYFEVRVRDSERHRLAKFAPKPQPDIWETLNDEILAATGLMSTLEGGGSGPLYIRMELGDGRVILFGDAAETWAGQVFANATDAEMGNPELSTFDTDLATSERNAKAVAKALDDAITDVCIVGNPAVLGQCGNPDCVCAPDPDAAEKPQRERGTPQVDEPGIDPYLAVLYSLNKQLTTPQLKAFDDLIHSQRVLFDDNNRPILNIATCGVCGMKWNDAAISSVTPVPSARCPFEHLHHTSTKHTKHSTRSPRFTRPKYGTAK